MFIKVLLVLLYENALCSPQASVFLRWVEVVSDEMCVSLRYWFGATWGSSWLLYRDWHRKPLLCFVDSWRKRGDSIWNIARTVQYRGVVSKSSMPHRCVRSFQRLRGFIFFPYRERTRRYTHQMFDWLLWRDRRVYHTPIDLRATLCAFYAPKVSRLYQRWSRRSCFFHERVLK